MRSARARSDDRTTRARIRDAAITCFADGGVAGTSVRTVAAAAGVSPALVIHHFSSKDGLQEACDTYVAETIDTTESSALAQGDTLDPFAAVRQMTSGPPLMRYLARMLVEDSTTVNRLVDTMVDNGVALTEAGVATGAVNATDDEYARSVAVLMWSLGAIVLHRHVERLLGGDVTGDLMSARRYLAATVEVLGRPVLTETAYQQLREALAASDGSPAPTPQPAAADGPDKEG